MGQPETVPFQLDQSGGDVDNRRDEQPARVQAEAERQQPALAFMNAQQLLVSTVTPRRSPR
jgi:hypothetical protein